MNRDWRITDVSPSAAAWAGSRVEDLMGADARVVNPAATRMIGARVEAALTAGAASVSELPSSHMPGRWVRISVGPHADGACVQFEDITPEAADGRSDEPVELPFGDGLVGGHAEIVLLDRRGVIVASNAEWRGALARLGMKPSDAGVGARYVDVAKAVVPKTDTVAFSGRLDELFSGRVSQLEATYTVATPRGRERRQVRITPIRIGEARFFLAIHEDLTERARVLAALHETSQQLLLAQETERQRIAVELHDSSGQNLAAILMGLQQLRRFGGEVARRADELGKLTQEVVQETRILSYLMNASKHQHEGLETAVRRFVEGIGRRAGLKANVQVDGEVDAANAAVQHAVFRVVQEAVFNVHRHAHARSLSVTLHCRDRVLTARIVDDGKGIGASEDGRQPDPPLGVGIPGMRVRIEQLGGQLTLDSSGRGTVVTAVIPF